MYTHKNMFITYAGCLTIKKNIYISRVSHQKWWLASLSQR